MADQIDSVTGGGNGFTVDNFTSTNITFNVPTTGSFDVWVSDSYRVTSSRPSGLFDLTLDSIQFTDNSSPATVSFVFPSVGGSETPPPYTSTFTVSWSDPFAGYVTESELNTRILQWWNTEVRPELLAINTTLESILAQLTPVATEAEGNVLADQFAKIRAQLTPTVLLDGESGTAPVLADQFTRIREQVTPITDEAQGESLADQFARLRYLGDPDANEVDNDDNHGTGIRQSHPYGTITNALAFENMLQNGSLLRNYDNEVNDANLQSFLDGLNNRNNSQVRNRSEERLSEIVSQFRGNSIFNNYK